MTTTQVPWWEIAAQLAERPQQTWAGIADVARTIDPTTVQTPMLDLVDQQLEWLRTKPEPGEKPRRLILSTPPQEGKSTRAARDFIIDTLRAQPDTRIVMASYAQSLASRNGRSVRNAIRSHPEFGLSLAEDTRSVSEWTLGASRGGVLSVGIGGSVTGRPADLLVIDDPIKDRQQADSDLWRETVWDWWTDAATPRLAAGAPVLLILTRWHEDDLAGRFITNEPGRWRVVNIPAQADHDPTKGETDPLGREPGDYLVSARGRTTADWEDTKRAVGARTWAALYQGRPSPPTGSIVHRMWWRFYDRLPDLTRAKVWQSWDAAFKGNHDSDYVVGQVWAQLGADRFLLDQYRGRWSFTETCAAIARCSEKWPQATAKLIEDKANGPAIIDHLRRTVPGMIAVEPHGDKVARAEAVSPLIQAGNVWLPGSLAGMPRQTWVDELVEEAAAFPNGANDDQVDALSQALSWSVGVGAKRKGTAIYSLG